MDPASTQWLATLPAALSIVGSVASTVALAMAIKAFARSRRFQRYVDREDEQNLQALETVLRGCADTIATVLEEPGGEARYFRSLSALLIVMPGLLAEYEMYIRPETRRLVHDFELALLEASTRGYDESLVILEGAQDHVGMILANLY